ncbi:DUF1998 domain-containing protein [Asticcacaulis taihuensis]
MSAGLDMWPSEQAVGETRVALLNACQVVDSRLAARLTQELGRKIRYFLTPAQAPERHAFGAQVKPDTAYMPFVRFPNWYFCPRCRVLKQIPWNSQSAADSMKCSNFGRRVDGSGEPCGNLKKNRRPSMSPVRFVAACEAGHIMDFPWDRWAHKANPSCLASVGDLYLYSTPAAGLAGIRVGCVKCGNSNSMAGAFRQDVLSDIYNGACPGHRPWLGPDGKETNCNHTPQTIQRGASNAYFAKVVSSILIPPYSAKIQQLLDRPDVWGEIEVSPLFDGKLHEPWLRKKAENLGVDPEAFIGAIYERLETPQGNTLKVEEKSEEKYRHDEYKAFLGPRPPKSERQDFDTSQHAAGEYGQDFAGLFDNVVLVRKLRETRVLTGFSRLMPAEASNAPPASLSLEPKEWLPGFSVRGEGIFLTLNQLAVSEWLKKSAVLQRTALLQERLSNLAQQRGTPTRVLTPQSVLVHSLSHLLIRQMAFESGYDSSSIRERLYVSSAADNPMAGLLLYTASGDAEGTLGGLVRQGLPGRLELTMRAAMHNAAICSSDPLCIESNGQGLFSLNLASCHACGLLPETSCEEGNLLLDRVMAIGSQNDSTVGYFSKLLT